MIPDCDLLGRYADRKDEEAFAELVRRHFDLVYSVALRLMGGDGPLAQDVAQKVFTDLARKARALSHHTALVSWLHTSTRYAALVARRGENRRRAREQEVYAMSDTTPTLENDWEQLRPVLDDAISGLSEPDRAAVLLRFFEGKSHREVGEALGLGENTARMRVERALEKLRLRLARKGLTTSAALLAATLGAHSVQAAPTGLAASVTGASLAGASSSAGLAGSFLKTFSLGAKTKMALAAAVLLTAATVVTVTQQQKITQLQTELTAAQIANSVASPQKAVAVPVSTADKIALIARVLQSNQSLVGLTHDLLDLFAGFQPADFSPLLDAFGQLPHNANTDLAKSLVLGQWAKFDPASALAWTKSRINDPSRKNDLLAIFQSWAVKDSAAAFAALDQVSDPLLRMEIQNTLLSWVSQHDPQAAFTILQQLPLGRQTTDAYAIIFSAWAGQNPTAASAAVLNLPPSLARTTAITSVASSWAQQDPPAALAWADSLSAGATRTAAIGTVLTMLAENDPPAATAYLNNLQSGSIRNGLVNTIASNWAATDPAAALAWVNSIANGQVQDKAIEGILAQMGQTDPAGAAAYLAQESVPTVLNVALPQLATTWAQQDIQSALAWVQSLPASAGSARNQAFQNVLGTWIQTDPASAAAYVQTIPNDSNFTGLADQLAKYWTAVDPEAALAWLQKLPEGHAQDNALRTALGIYASEAPQAAWDYGQALPENPTDNSKERILSMIVTTWSDQDPAQAAALVTTIPFIGNNPGVGLATETIAANWLKQDPDAAVAWIDSLPAGGPRDRAVQQIIVVEGKNDLATAFIWVRSMQGGTGLRERLLNSIVEEWARKDPAAVTAAIMAEIPDPTPRRTSLLNMVKQNAPSQPVAPPPDAADASAP